MAKCVKASSIAAPKGKVITIKADVLGKNASVKSNSGGYTINLNGRKFVGTGKVDTLTVAANNANVDAGAGNDVVTVSGLKVTLNGEAGNDSLRSEAGADTLSGGKGDDVIYGFENNDLLQITGVFSASYNSSKKEIAFKVGNTANAITLTDFGKTTTFHVNNDTYQISGTKLIKK